LWGGYCIVATACEPKLEVRKDFILLPSPEITQFSFIDAAMFNNNFHPMTKNQADLHASSVAK
jgi:hypothetical protein